jgi:hypothetical protein
MQHAMTHAVESSTLADVLERVLDKGIVIAGDIKVKLVDIELLSIQIRLVVCSVDKAREMGMDWWVNNPVFCGQPQTPQLDARRPPHGRTAGSARNRARHCAFGRRLA